MARDRLLTSAAAARAFDVGVSSIKRWTDEGELEAVRTRGGHRRYTALALHRFASIRGLRVDHLPPIDGQPVPSPADVALYEALVHGDHESVRRLIEPGFESLPKRAAFLDRVVGEALREIGYRWERGDLGVDQEHRASQLVIDSVDRLRPPEKRDARLALLICPPREWHDLPLRLVRLVFEWSEWRTEMIGCALPWKAGRDAVDRWKPELVAFSSRTGDPFQDPEFDRLVDYCAAKNVRVIVGGEWARGGASATLGYLRFRTLRGFERWLRTQ